MAINREKKGQLVAEYARAITQSKGIIVADFRRLTVKQAEVLRRKVREAQGNYLVCKNTLLQRALETSNMPTSAELLTGPMAVCFCYGEVAAVAKVLIDFAKESKILEIRGGWLGANLVSADTMRAVADLPPMEIIRAQLIGMLSAPARQVAGAIASGVRQMVNVLNAYSRGESKASSVT